MTMKSRWLARTARLGAVPAAAVAVLFLAGTSLAAPTWTLQQPPVPAGTLDANAFGVSCSVASACVAVANNETTAYTDVWDGTNWTLVNVPNGTTSTLEAVSCTAPNACTAVGGLASPPLTSQPLALRWDGTSWTAQTVPAPAGTTSSLLTGVSCTSATHCVAVSNSNYTEVWSNGHWKVHLVDQALHGVSCASGTFCVAITVGTPVEMWNGSSWTEQTLPMPSGATFFDPSSVSCGSATSCTIVGRYEISPSTLDHPLAIHWDGTSWALQSFPAMHGSTNLHGVSCARPGKTCTAVGDIEHPVGSSGQVVVVHWNGTRWTRDLGVVIPPNSRANGLTAVSCHTTVTCVGFGISEASTGSAITLIAEHES
jgi:hypothetical protein